MRFKVSYMPIWMAEPLREVEGYTLCYFLCHINITISLSFVEFRKFLFFIFSIICSYFRHMPSPVNLITLTSCKHITTQLIPLTHYTHTYTYTHTRNGKQCHRFPFAYDAWRNSNTRAHKILLPTFQRGQRNR